MAKLRKEFKAFKDQNVDEVTRQLELAKGEIDDLRLRLRQEKTRRINLQDKVSSLKNDVQFLLGERECFRKDEFPRLWKEVGVLQEKAEARKDGEDELMARWDNQDSEIRFGSENMVVAPC